MARITPSSPLPSLLNDYHISASFIDDSFCTKCESHQNRPFLCQNAKPAVGQRVEVLMFLRRRREGDGDTNIEAADEGEFWNEDHVNKIRPFRLSGEVVEVGPMPSFESPPEPVAASEPSPPKKTRRISLDSSDDKPDEAASSSTSTTDKENADPTNAPSIRYLYPSTSHDDAGPGLGSLFLADIVRSCITRQRQARMSAPTPHMLEEWNKLDMRKRGRLVNHMINRWGAVHGQEIVVEARLNFDYDIRRGTENGPWADLIPIDGRDVWRFTMAYNDQYDNDTWHAIPTSFQNMGRNIRNRCWPWTQDENLPYRRSGADAPIWGNGPGGALQVHCDLGPFLERNVARQRPKSLQAYAA